MRASREVELYTYPIPWDVINISSAERAAYEAIMREPLDPQYAYTGASTSLFRHLPNVMRPASALQGDGRTRATTTLYLLPLSPWPLCFVAEEALRRFTRIKWSADRYLKLGMTHTPVERIMDSARLSSRNRMTAAATYPRTDFFNRTRHTCAAYERAVEWVIAQPTWRRAPERHLWVYEFPHYYRAALQTELRFRGCAETLYAKVALGVFLTQEDRLPDWAEARAQHRLVLLPFYSPPFFEFDAGRGSSDGGGLEHPEYKDLTVVESSGNGVSCHRFDTGVGGLPKGTSWGCHDAALKHANSVRDAAKFAVSHLTGGSLMSPMKRAEHYNTSALQLKAALYNRSTFCLVPPGDSAITPRISSFIAALCIPVFTFSREFLPFTEMVPWGNISLTVNPFDLLRYQTGHTAALKGKRAMPDNPLEFLRRIPRDEVRRMQRALLDARRHLLYRNDVEGPSAVHSVARELEGAFGECRGRGPGRGPRPQSIPAPGPC